MKYIVNDINNIQNYQPIFRDTPCCLGSYTCTVVLEAGNRVCVLCRPFRRRITGLVINVSFCPELEHKMAFVYARKDDVAVASF